jgi:hypothetical protein
MAQDLGVKSLGGKSEATVPTSRDSIIKQSFPNPMGGFHPLDLALALHCGGAGGRTAWHWANRFNSAELTVIKASFLALDQHLSCRSRLKAEERSG